MTFVMMGGGGAASGGQQTTGKIEIDLDASRTSTCAPTSAARRSA